MSRNVVVLGGTGGIGKATAEAFLKKGDRVLVSGTDQSKLDAIAQEFNGFYDDQALLTQQADLTISESVDSLAEYIQLHLGTCNILVNSAGVFRDGLLHESKEEDFDLQFDVNVKSVYNSCKAFIPMMLDNQEGAIINVASISGIGGDYNAPLYSASKAAVINLTRAMAMDYAEHGLRINVVSPSATKTPMFITGSTQEVINSFTEVIPNGRIGEPSQVAEVIVFLASSAAKHINGQNFPVDGGLSAWSGQPRQDKTGSKS